MSAKDSSGSYKPTIKNKRASFEYSFLEVYQAGIVLNGTEIKSVREGKVQFTDAFCTFRDGELFVMDMHISPYEFGNINNTDPRRPRKLLLSKREMAKLQSKSEEQGLTIIPVRLYFNERNFAKIEIALAKGKKLYDKRNDIKAKDTERIVKREMAER